MRQERRRFFVRSLACVIYHVAQLSYLPMHGGTGPIRDKAPERGEGKGACNLLRNPSASTDRSSRGRRRARKDNGVSERCVRRNTCPLT